MSTITRYLYIKNGDVATQMERIATLWPQPITSGPDAFIYDFVTQNQECSILLLSRSQRKVAFRYRNATALVYPEKLGIFGRAPARIMYFFGVLIRALNYRPDRILCGATGGPLWASYIVSRILSVPLVHSRHNRVTFEGDRWYRRIALAIDGFIVRRADGVVCHGPYLKHELEQSGVTTDKLLEFDVGFSDMINTGASNDMEWSAWMEEMYLLYMGRIERNKGVFDLLDAASELFTQNYPSFRLVFAGDGRHLAELREAVRERGLEKRVVILGRVPHEYLGPIIRKSRVVVTPTHSDFPEGRCMAAMEALIMGVPVIASAFGPFPYLVEHGVNGLLFPPGSVKDLRICISRLLDNDGERQLLAEGAELSGRKLLDPPRTFSQAVNQAFNTENASQLYINE